MSTSSEESFTAMMEEPSVQYEQPNLKSKTPKSAKRSPSQASRASSLKTFISNKFFSMTGRQEESRVERRFTFHLEAALDKKANKKLGKGGVDLGALFKDESAPIEDFNQIVDLDDAQTENYVSQNLMGAVVDSIPFKFTIFLLIILNAISIGIQTDYDLAIDYQQEFFIFEEIVMSAFTIEIILKWYHGFAVFWKSGWNLLDFFIIAALLLGPQLTFLSSTRALRILRILRALRSLKSVSVLQGLGTIVQTILQSIPDMANIVLLLGIIFMVLGVTGASVFAEYLPEYFENLYHATYSLFICVTQDGWVDILNLFKEQGGLVYFGGALFLFVGILICAFIFSNLIVAVVVTNLELALKELKGTREKDDLNSTSANAQKSDPLQKKTSGASKDIDLTLIHKEIPLVDFKKELQRKAKLCTQLPLEKSDLKYLNTEKVEKYLFLLTTLESNLREYDAIKKDLEKVLSVVTRVNSVQVDTEAHAQWFADYNTAKRNTVAGAENLDLMLQGDIMSGIMRLEEKRGTEENKSRGVKTEDMSEIIRSSVDPSAETKATRRKNDVMKRRMSAMRTGSSEIRRRGGAPAAGRRASSEITPITADTIRNLAQSRRSSMFRNSGHRMDV